MTRERFLEPSAKVGASTPSGRSDSGNFNILEPGCHSGRRELLTKTGCLSLNAAFCRLFFLQLPSSQIDMAEACGSRSQTLDSQLAANDDVAASAKFQLESIGSERHRGLLPCFLLGLVSRTAELLTCVGRPSAQVSELLNLGSISLARSRIIKMNLCESARLQLNCCVILNFLCVVAVVRLRTAHPITSLLSDAASNTASIPAPRSIEAAFCVYVWFNAADQQLC